VADGLWKRIMTAPVDQDIAFFTDHPDRQARIREPAKKIEIGRQRGAAVVDEMQGEFWSLGDHDKSRRRVIVYRVPRDNPMYDPKKPQLLKIPILLFADETIVDEDRVLLPEVDRIMREAYCKMQGSGS
jgi:hypothetical protein